MDRNLKLIAYLLFAIGLPIWLFYLSRVEEEEKATTYKIEIDSTTLIKVLAHLEDIKHPDGINGLPDSIMRKISLLERVAANNTSEIETLRINKGETLQSNVRGGAASTGRLLWIANNFPNSILPAKDKDTVLTLAGFKKLSFEVDEKANFAEAAQSLLLADRGGNKYRVIVIHIRSLINVTDTASFFKEATRQQIPVIFFKPTKFLPPYASLNDHGEYSDSTATRIYQLLRVFVR